MFALVNNDIMYNKFTFVYFPLQHKTFHLEKKIFVFVSVTSSTRKVDITSSFPLFCFLVPKSIEKTSQRFIRSK